MTLPAVFAQALTPWPTAAQRQFTSIRSRILDIAAAEQIQLEETLKWGEPAFVPPRKFGTTLRVALSTKVPDQMGVFVHCSTSLIEDMKALYPGNYDGTRGLLWPMDSPAPQQSVDHLIARALRYHCR